MLISKWRSSTANCTKAISSGCKMWNYSHVINFSLSACAYMFFITSSEDRMKKKIQFYLWAVQDSDEISQLWRGFSAAIPASTRPMQCPTETSSCPLETDPCPPNALRWKWGYLSTFSSVLLCVLNDVALADKKQTPLYTSLNLDTSRFKHLFVCYIYLLNSFGSMSNDISPPSYLQQIMKGGNCEYLNCLPKISLVPTDFVRDLPKSDHNRLERPVRVPVV